MFVKHSLKKVYWLAFLISVYIFTLFGAGIMLREFPQKEDGGVRFVIIRYDDYRLYKDYEDPQYRRYQESILSGREEELLKFLLMEHIKMTIALVPFAISEDRGAGDEVIPSKMQLLIEGIRKKLFEVALHGYQHRNNIPKDWIFSEFKGMPLSIQMRWIEKGKNKLDTLLGSETKIFVPPFNRWDENTLISLLSNDFSILSAEAREFPNLVSIRYFPYTTTPKEFQFLLSRNSINKINVIVVNIHPHDLSEGKNRIGLSGLKNLLKELKYSYGKMELVSFEEAVAKRIVFTQEELSNLSKIFNHIQFWKNLPSKYLIRTQSLCANRPYFCNPVLYLFRVILAFNMLGLGMLISKEMGQRIRVKIMIYGIITLFGIVLFIILWRSVEYLIYNEVIAGKRYSAIFLMFGIISGLILKTLKIWK